MEPPQKRVDTAGIGINGHGANATTLEGLDAIDQREAPFNSLGFRDRGWGRKRPSFADTTPRLRGAPGSGVPG